MAFYNFLPIELPRLNTIQPFTYNDNVTYLRKLEDIAAFLDNLRERFNDFVDESPVGELTTQFNERLASIVAAIDEQVNLIRTAVTENNATLTAQIAAQDKAIHDQINALDMLIDSKKTEFDALVTRAESLFKASNDHLTQAVGLYEGATKQYELANSNNAFVVSMEPRVKAIETANADLLTKANSMDTRVTALETSSGKTVMDALKTWQTTKDNQIATLNKLGIFQQSSLKTLDNANKVTAASPIQIRAAVRSNYVVGAAGRVDIPLEPGFANGLISATVSVLSTDPYGNQFASLYQPMCTKDQISFLCNDAKGTFIPAGAVVTCAYIAIGW